MGSEPRSEVRGAERCAGWCISKVRCGRLARDQTAGWARAKGGSGERAGSDHGSSSISISSTVATHTLEQRDLVEGVPAGLAAHVVVHALAPVLLQRHQVRDRLRAAALWVRHVAGRTNRTPPCSRADVRPQATAGPWPAARGRRARALLHDCTQNLTWSSPRLSCWPSTVHTDTAKKFGLTLASCGMSGGQGCARRRAAGEVRARAGAVLPRAASGASTAHCIALARLHDAFSPP